MWYNKLIDRRLETIEIEFFHDDPDGDPDRAGDGWYFRFPGDQGWSGAWGWAGEALSMARDQLLEEYYEIEWKVENFSKRYVGVYQYMAIGTANKPMLSYDPFAVLWVGSQAGDSGTNFHLLVSGTNASAALQNAKSRLGKDAEFTIRKTRGKLKSLCRQYRLPHPRGEI